jgi:ABC-2 type transport system permease protein
MTKTVDSPKRYPESKGFTGSDCREEGLRFADGARAAWMLAKREWIRFFRQRNRVTAAIAQPLLFWLLFGTGMKGSFSGAGELDFIGPSFIPASKPLVPLG